MTNKNTQPLFNAGAAVYDSFKFLHAPAERTVELAGLKPGFRVLDLACGSGRASITAAHIVGDSGSVTGIDIADKLLEVAVENTARAGLNNVTYRFCDATDTGFDDNEFDAVVCASSLFLFSDIPGALKEACRVLKPGGSLALSVFGDMVFQPVIDLINDSLAHYEDIVFPEPFTSATDSPQKCLDFLMAAGIVTVDITTENLPFTVENVDEGWRQVANSLLVRPKLAKLDKPRYQAVKKEVQESLASLMTPQGLEIDVPVIFCRISID